MIKKANESKVFDEFVADMLKKGSFPKGFTQLFETGTEALEQGAKKGPPPSAFGPQGVKPVAKPETPKPPEAAKVTEAPASKPPAAEPSTSAPKTPAPPKKHFEPKPKTDALKATVSEAFKTDKKFYWVLQSLDSAIIDIIQDGKVASDNLIFKEWPPEKVLKQVEQTISPEYFDPKFKKMEQLANQLPNTSKNYKAYKKMTEGVKTFKEDIVKNLPELRKVVDQTKEVAPKVEPVKEVVEEAVPAAAKVTPEVTDASSALYHSTIETLRKSVRELTEREKKLVDDLIKVNKEAGYWKGVLDGMEKAGLQGTQEYKIVKQVSEEVSGEAARTTEKVKASIPEPPKTTPVVEKAASKAAAEGAQEGAEAATEAAVKTSKPADETAEAVGDAGKTKDPKKPKDPKDPGDPDKPLNNKNTFLSELIKSYGKKTGTELATKPLFSIAATVLLVGGAAVWWWTRSPGGKDLLSELERSMSRVISLLEGGNILFNQDSDGLIEAIELLDIYKKGLSSLRGIDTERDLSQIKNHLSSLDEIRVDSQEFLDDRFEIEKDLFREVGWDEVIEEISNTIVSLDTMIPEILNKKDDAEDELRGVSPGGEVASPPGGSRGVSPGASVIPRFLPKSEEGSEEESNSFKEKIPGTNIVLDYENAPADSAGFKSAARKIINNVLTSPAGLAFIDPEGAIWTGALSRSSKTPDENYYWRAIKYLYDHGIVTPGRLRRHMKHQLKKWKRGNSTAWKDALKYYRGSLANKYSYNIYLDLMLKTANLNKVNETSINKEGNSMKIKKFSDEHSNKYIQDALQGLSDEYAKSYFSGLKGMYDERLSSSESDKEDLYHPHGGSGAKTLSEAHPESLTIAESMGRGGLVENLLEKQKGSYEVALSDPTGNFRHKRAKLLASLAKRANDADLKGNIKLSNFIDEIIVDLTN